jgi:O-antigen/teichoic acid export membrane protein
VRAWPRRSISPNAMWGLLDQGLYSGSNLLLTVVVARSVPAAEFGAFSLCYVVYMLSLGLGRVTGSKPYTIEAAGEAAATARVRARALLGYALGLGAVAAAVSLAVGKVVGSPLSLALIVLAPLLPGLLLQDAVRGLYFASRRARGAFLNDATWTMLQVLALSGLLVTGHASVGPLLAAWGVPAAVAAAVGVMHLRVLPSRPRLVSWLRPSIGLAAPLAANLVLTAAPSYLAYLAMPAVSSLDQLAVVRGAYVFFGPLNVLFTGAAMVALPAFLHAAPDRPRDRMSMQLSAGLAAFAVAWGALVVFLPDRVGTLVLGTLWDDTATTRLLLAVSLVAEAMLVGPEIVLSSLRLPGRMTSVRLMGALVTLGSSLALATRFGADGLAAGFVIGYSVSAMLATAQVARVGGEVRTVVLPPGGPPVTAT